MELNYKNNKEIINEHPVAWIAGAIAAAGGGYTAYKYSTLSHYKQQMIKNQDGFFEPDMYVGEYFEVEKFTGNEDVYEVMNLDAMKSQGWLPFKDDYGYYIKFSKSSTSDSTDLRLYLPKKEWFAQFQGKIKSIKDKVPGETKSNKYTLCFYLKNPEKAIKTKVLKPDGSTFFGPPMNFYDAETKTYIDEPSRGWDVLSTYKQSGYFTTKGDVLTGNLVENYNDGNENILSEFLMPPVLTDPTGEYKAKSDQDAIAAAKKRELSGLYQQLSDLSTAPPSGLQEYMWGDYGGKYGKSEFDQWYDSSNGTWIIIGTQICAAIALSPAATYLSGYATSRLAGQAIYWSVTIGGEIMVGGWEAAYLYSRGMTSQAALVAFCCFLPFFTESLAFGKLIGRPPGFDDAIEDLVWGSTNGAFKSPAEFKAWFNGLNENLKTELKTTMTLCGQYSSKLTSKQIQQQIIDGMVKSTKNIKRGIELTSQGVQWGDVVKLKKGARFFKLGDAQITRLKETVGKPVGYEIKNGKYLGLKSFGLNILVIGGLLMPITVFVIGDDEEFKKDPQKILEQTDKKIKSLSYTYPKAVENLEKKCVLLSNKIKVANQSGNIEEEVQYTKEYFKIIKQLYTISQNGWDITRKFQYHNYIEIFKTDILAQLQKEFITAHNKNERSKANKTVQEIKNIDPNFVSNLYAPFFTGTKYLNISNGYIDPQTGKKITITNDLLNEFLYWFTGFDFMYKKSTIEGYQTKNGISIKPEFTYKDAATKKDTVVSKSFDNQNTINSIIYSANEDGKIIMDETSKYYWGNYFVIRYIFQYYYDDYLLSKKTTTETTIK